MPTSDPSVNFNGCCVSPGSTLVKALVLSRLDYCAPLLVGVSGALVARLQRIHNYAARLVCRLHWRDGVTTSLKELRWLPVERRIRYRLGLLVYKSLKGRAPQYLTELLQDYQPTRDLRSAGRGLLTPHNTKSMAGGRAFRAAAPELWNSLPDAIRKAKSLNQFALLLYEFLSRD